MATVKLDENVPDSVGGILQQGGHAEGRVLVSLDRDFTNILRHPPEPTAGIVVIRLRDQTLPLIRQVAATLRDVLSQESVRGRLWVLDESRLRIWPRGPA